MDLTPERQSRSEPTFVIAADAVTSPRHHGRPKKPPPVTPRRFRKFFTPRPRNAQQIVRTSRAALRNISNSALNQRQNRPKLDQRHILNDDRPAKRRRLSFSSAISSIQSSPIKYDGISQQPDHEANIPKSECDEEEEAETEIEDEGLAEDYEPPIRHLIPRITHYSGLCTSARFLSSRITGRTSVRETKESGQWQIETASFVSSALDVHMVSSDRGAFLALPFSTTACKTNSLIAVGDEEGVVRLLDSAINNKDGFQSCFLKIQPHDNAIMDLEFSYDDSYLATASGDQTCQIIDMKTQTAVHCLSGHNSSIKQVRFQPATGSNVLATTSRDGCVNIWDLRDAPNKALPHPFQLRSEPTTTRSNRYIIPRNTIRDAHTREGLDKGREWKSFSTLPARADSSVTSLSFLSETRPHLFVTASETDGTVKLWDMRSSYTNRRGLPNPVSSTDSPQGHKRLRPYGINSLAIDTDGSKIYTLCRDHTIYVYSTSHLLIGGSPELSLPAPTRAYNPRDKPRSGLGPLYAFKHPRLYASSFYPKISIRKATDSTSEVLAVGSSDDCAILFPTNERYLTSSLESKSVDSLSIYSHGTALTRGHDKEVTAVTWSFDGDLITASDDFSVRCWREDPCKAKELRTMGEAEGRRWRAGWAEVRDPRYDDEE